MDAWEEVDGRLGVWQIAREMYGSVCLCISNRSRATVAITIDTTSASNCLVLASNLDDGIVRCIISPSKTVVVCVFSPEEDLMPMRVCYDTSVQPNVEHPAAALQMGNNVDQALVAASAQTNSIQHWLARRK